MRLCLACGRLLEDSATECALDGKELVPYDTTIPAGEVVAGRYRIVKGLGVGPSGEVYEAAEQDGGETVVVRVLTEEVCNDKRLSDVVRRHLMKQKDFQHKYAMRLHAVDSWGGRIVVVRDLVDGVRLDDVLQREGALPAPRVLGLALRICTVLAEAHKVGLLHLQIRASNVFVVPAQAGEDESVRLVDFGVGPRKRIAGKPVYGSPATLSPEQIEGKIVSFKADIFATGLLLYRMLGGRPAYSGDDEEVVTRILEDPVPPLEAGPHGPVPAELEALVREALEKKPIHRPIGMGQMCDRLRQFQDAEAVERMSVEPALQPAEPAEPAGLGAGTAIARVALRRAGPATLRPPPGLGPPAGAAPPAGETAPLPEGSAAEERAVAEDETPTLRVDTTAPPAIPEAASAQAGAPAAPVTADDIVVGSIAPFGDVPEPSSPTMEIEPQVVDLVAPREGPIAIPPASSPTMEIEPEIVEEAVVPPPLRPPVTKPPPSIRPPPIGRPDRGEYRKGLVHGLAAGVAVAVLAVVLALVLRSPPPPAATGPSPGERAGETERDAQTRLVAEGPIQVTTAEEDAAAGVIADARPEARPEARPGPGRDEVAAADAAEAVEEAGPAEAAGAVAEEAGGPVAGREVARPRDGGSGAVARDGGRVAAQEGAARADAGPVAAADMARANELVQQGDRALAARDFAGARAAYEEALSLRAQDNRARIGLGRVAFQQQNFEEAVRYLEPAYRNQGNMELGMAYVRVGRLGDAKRQFELILARNPENGDARRALEAVARQLGP